MEFSLKNRTEITFERIKQEVKEGKNPYNKRMARKVFEDLRDFSDKNFFKTKETSEFRDLIFDFYRAHSDQRKINNSSLSPVKKMLDYMIEDLGKTEPIRRDLKMVRDTIKEENIEEEDSDDNLKILSPEEQSKLLDVADEEEQFIINIFLETGARIGEISALKEEDYDEKENELRIEKQYIQELGVVDLEYKERSIPLSTGTGNSLQEFIDENDSKYLFGESSQKAYNHLGNVLKKLGKEIDVELRSEILRTASAHNKMKSGVSESKIKETYLGMKSDRRLENIREKMDE